MSDESWNNEGYNHSLHHTPPETVEVMRAKAVKDRDSNLRLEKFVKCVACAGVCSAVGLLIWLILHS